LVFALDKDELTPVETSFHHEPPFMLRLRRTDLLRRRDIFIYCTFVNHVCNSQVCHSRLCVTFLSFKWIRVKNTRYGLKRRYL
jgi:hypothetical protein